VKSGRGTSIIHDGRAVALKWHRLRRRRADPLFGADVLAEGLKVGASMEIDLRVTADGDFAVLHDDVLDKETNGRGPVAERARAALAALRYDDAGVPGAARYTRRLVFLDGLAALLANAHPDALLQLDMKDEFAAVGERGLDRFAGALKDEKLPLLVSGDSSELILAIKQRLPHIAHGIEPSFRLIELFQKGDAKGAVAQLRTELAERPEPQMVYLNWQLILGAAEQGVDLVAMCRDAGKKVDAWTFTLADPAGFSDREWRDFSRLLALGVDQITTDEAIATEQAYLARTEGARPRPPM
jgi:glycerophosphoryl diester phosphodiesterase